MAACHFGQYCPCWLVHWSMSALHLSMQLLQKLEMNLVVFQRNLTFSVSSAGIWQKETEDFMPLEEALCVSSVFLQEDACSLHLAYLRSWPRIRFSRSDGTRGCIPASPSHTVYLVNLKMKEKVSASKVRFGFFLFDKKWFGYILRK